MQVKIVYVCFALHNFIMLHGDNKGDWEGDKNNVNGERVEEGDVKPARQDVTITRSIRDRLAKERRNKIASCMWREYQTHLRS